MILKKTIKQHLVNIPGWRTNRKIVVFESDDWGSIRMPSKKTYTNLLNKGYQVDQCIYNKNDALESNDDLLGLLEVLTKHKDHLKNPTIFTLNSLVANPDFEKIKKSNFKKYYFEDLEQTYLKYPNHSQTLTLYKKGIQAGAFQIQFHGREHLNVNRWMNSLHKNDKISLEAFKNQMFTLHEKGGPNGRVEYLDAFGYGYSKEYESIESIIQSGTHLFKKTWGFNSSSFIAPNYYWNTAIEREMLKNNTRYIQGTHVQKVPAKNGTLQFKKKYHYLGQMNKFNQTYLVRNAFFEPTSDPNKDWVNSCLKEIAISFLWHKPAIISSHRVNYIGGIHSENRSKNLKLLNQLLQKLIKKYPMVEFMSSDALGDLINSK